jgi:hypothetical protein
MNPDATPYGMLLDASACPKNIDLSYLTSTEQTPQKNQKYLLNKLHFV